jgi:dihydroorotase-like cyclic amidohydrolase
MRILISGGTVISASGAAVMDVLTDGERIAGLAAPGTEIAASWAQAADRVIDAAGRYVLPGGIDAHTHMEMPFGGTFSADTFETGTRAAAWGGTTTIIDFAVQAKGTSLLSTLDSWHAKADGRCAIDYGFHMIVSDVNDTTLKEMEACIDAGVNSFKMFMAYPGVFYATDGEILRAMQQAARTGALVMMHAENGIAIDQLVAQAVSTPQGNGLATTCATSARPTCPGTRLAASLAWMMQPQRSLPPLSRPGWIPPRKPLAGRRHFRMALPGLRTDDRRSRPGCDDRAGHADGCPRLAREGAEG